MAKLLIQLNGEVREWALGSFALTIGRRPDNSLVLDERFVSGRHAVVGHEQGRYYVEDLKSSNGTLLNGQPVQRAALQHGDCIRIGTLELHFIDEPVRLIPAPAPPPPPAAEPRAEGEPAAVADTAMLDELMGSIRSHRDREQREREELAQRIRQEWDKWLLLAEQIKAKVGADPRVKYFGIDRRANDVIIRLQRHAGGPQQMITVALEHPDYRGQPSKGIWLIRTGERDRCVDSAQTIATELIRDLAFALA
ncbi:FHA domain-containing protein [Fontimonas sp. SYSU GA230001]|uniref:FHA domain-containing protein n=1 Tax=Fontimonas sp. SYSU GA230001 TaxID=3142450 RepID=UPI0032B5472C